ncbi:uncharacterized protein EI97DRAFT_471705 [Westerdykella ornata]|uniref:Uncharacterized protein n=1 Tax=Westerdykella ornata TaxID=318751 RepID=A0A6A6JVU2_WESOR|nr:uncharacterized protein EI97DRAFT_471705 [Westerdykella ornata]KAF2280731.1 hypothetical protein EI97DRAFT_471705 [Westerdykella ornata]
MDDMTSLMSAFRKAEVDPVTGLTQSFAEAHIDDVEMADAHGVEEEGNPHPNGHLTLPGLDPKIRAMIFEELWGETPVIESFFRGHPMYVGRGDTRMPVTRREKEAFIGHGLPTWLLTSKQFLNEGLKHFAAKEVKISWNRAETPGYWDAKLPPTIKRFWSRSFGLLELTIGAAKKISIQEYLDDTFQRVKGLDRSAGGDFADFVDALLDAGTKVRLLRFNIILDYNWILDQNFKCGISLVQMRKLAPLPLERLIIEFRSNAHPWRATYDIVRNSRFTMAIRAEINGVVRHIFGHDAVENEILFDPNDIEYFSSQEEYNIQMQQIVASSLLREYENVMRERKEELAASQYRRIPEDDPFEYLDCGATLQFDCKKDADTAME